MRQLWFGLRLHPQHREWLEQTVQILNVSDQLAWDCGKSTLDALAACADADDRVIVVIFAETHDDQLTEADTAYLCHELSKVVFTYVFQPATALLSSVDADDPDINNFRLLLANLRFHTGYPVPSVSPSRHATVRFSEQPPETIESGEV